MSAMTSHRSAIYLFTATLFLSATLMFSIQPMIGKMLLPIVGGTPAGWIVAMAFFQVALLAGYFLAYGMARLSPLHHCLLFMALLGVGACFLPARLSPEAGMTLGAADTFKLLAVSIGIPFMVLSATSTSIQRLFGATGHPAAADPYFLYAASNIGSLAGLLLYPLVIEPRLRLGMQAEAWFVGYCILVFFVGMTLFFLRRQEAKVEDTPADPIPLSRKLRWIAYAFVPASLLFGYTAFITRDIYSAPLIWVLPLGLYLVTFIVAFGRHRKLSSDKLRYLHIAAVAVSMVLIMPLDSALRGSLSALFCNLACLGVLALAFHIRLVEDRPLGSGKQLAEFYLLISFGGALAGLFNAFIAPFVFDRTLELPLTLLLALLLHPGFRAKINPTQQLVVGLAAIIFLFCIFLAVSEPASFARTNALLIFVILFAAVNPRALAVFCAGALIFGLLTHQENVVERSRNFYGTIVVRDKPLIETATNKVYTARYIEHGTTVHGYQVLDDDLRHKPASYYAALRSVFELYQPENVMVIGLGAGALNCYSTPRTNISFIEIDPAVIDIARRHFTYLSGCLKGRETRVILGDGRLEMEKIRDEKFDLIVVDVFSSDYIPMHLMTLEAIKLYADRLTKDGILLFHISNIYFSLTPPLAAAATELGFDAKIRFYITPQHFYENPSLWVAMSRDKETLGPLLAYDWKQVPPEETVEPWTDDYSDFLSVLSALRHHQKKEAVK